MLEAKTIMPSLLSKALQLITGDDTDPLKWTLPSKKRPFMGYSERDLINLESEIGSTLFGEVPKGHRREFFCLDANTWIWHEEWIDEAKKLQTSTVRYEVQDQGILKVQQGARYSYLEGQELANFAAAVNIYYERVAREIYKVDPDTGVKLG